MSKDVPTKSDKVTHFVRRVVIETVLLLVVFLLGFVPMWLKARDSASRLAEAERHCSTCDCSLGGGDVGGPRT